MRERTNGGPEFLSSPHKQAVLDQKAEEEVELVNVGTIVIRKKGVVGIQVHFNHHKLSLPSP